MTFSRRSFLHGSATLAGLATSTNANAQPADVKSPTYGREGQRFDGRSDRSAVAANAMARHAAEISYEDLSAETVNKTKRRILDLVGCAIGGARGRGNAVLTGMQRRRGGTPEASVIGYPVKGAASDVAMLNAIIARSYDFEVMTVVVGDRSIPSHHSPTTCMTALAMAEAAKASGKEFVTALAVGDDIAARLLAASGLDFTLGWDGAPVYSALAAAAIASRFQGATADQTRNAMGLAVDMIAGSVQNIWDGATSWKLPQGVVARNGVMAAELAKGGWTGIADPLLAPYGFFAQYTGGCDHPEWLTQELGSVFYGEEYFKPYPACQATHLTIECAIALCEAYAPEVGDIESIVLYVSDRSLNNFFSKPFEVRTDPHCDANFSNVFMVANVLLHGGVRQEHYAEEAVSSPAIAALTGKTILKPLPSGKEGVMIDVVMNSGKVHRTQNPGTLSKDPRHGGSTMEEIVKKYRQQTAFAGFLPDRTVNEIEERVLAIENEKDMAGFMKLLTRHTL